MVEASEDSKINWEVGLCPKISDTFIPQDITILWVDKNIDNPENKWNLELFKGANKRISRFVCMRTIEGAIKCITLHSKEIDLIISSGSYSNPLLKTIHKKFKTKYPFQIVIFCCNVAMHKAKFKKYGLLRFISDDSSEVVKLIQNFQRRIERYTGNIVNSDENPYAFGEEITKLVFIREAGNRYQFNFSKKVIKENLLLAGMKCGEKQNYAIAEIEESIDWALNNKLFKVFTKECFIYKETNRRLRQHLTMLPIEIFHSVNFKQIQNMTFDHPAFQQLVPILPFAIELNKLINEFNSPGFFQKDHTIKEGVLWRGINLNEMQKTKFIDSEGLKIGFPAFSSSTKLKSKTEEFMPTVLIRFTFPPINYKMIYPIDISPFSIFENEAEVLFPAGSEFIIRSAEYEKNTRFKRINPIY